MAKVWVQVWLAQVPGSVQVEESELRQVEGLDSVKAMVPMLVTVQDSVMDLAKLEELVEVLPPQGHHHNQE
jgi:hypothetical protein